MTFSWAYAVAARDDFLVANSRKSRVADLGACRETIHATHATGSLPSEKIDPKKSDKLCKQHDRHSQSDYPECAPAEYVVKTSVFEIPR